MQLSHNGIELIKDREGFRGVAYKDTGGVWTVGYGTIKVDGIPVQEGQTCSLEQACLWLENDVRWAQTAVNKAVKVPLNQNQFDALVSFVYNVGEDAFYKSTLLRKLNAGDYHGAAKEFERWVLDNGKVIPGLVSRRHQEEELFES